MNDYNLIYYRKIDGRKFFGRRVLPTEYHLIDSITGDTDKWTHHKLGIFFHKDEQNKLFRLPQESMARKRKVKINSKAFREYLYGETV